MHIGTWQLIEIFKADKIDKMITEKLKSSVMLLLLAQCEYLIRRNEFTNGALRIFG